MRPNPKGRRAKASDLTKGWHPDEQRWLKRFRDTVATKHADAVKDIVLFGSKARGDWNEDSDIDVLLIVRNDAADVQEAIQQIGHELAVPSCAVPSIVTRTEAEWARLGAMDAAFHGAVERDGVSLL